MTPAEIHQRLAAALPDAVLAFEDALIDPVISVKPDQILAVGRLLKDDPDLRLTYLRLLTGTDQPPESIDVVYHLWSYEHGHPCQLRARLPRDHPTIATVSKLWPDADYYEREAFDLVGITFTDHPNLRRIMMPDDWVGHPLRKDYQRPETYHGLPTVRSAVKPGEPLQVTTAQHELKAEPVSGYMQINMGPHHPATHGVINFLVETDGEIIKRATPDIGYLHRGIEKIAEVAGYPGTMPYTDRVDYLGAMFTNHGWSLAVEQLTKTEVPRRAEFCRVIASELNRIASHLIATGALAMDLGAFTPFVHWIREREKINDFMERICGARLTYHYMRIGGVARDIDAETLDMILRWLDHFEPMMDEFDRLISDNEIFIKRLAHITVISPEDAIAYGLVGPNLRASGIDWDTRKNEAYSIYPELDFDVPLGVGARGSVGDAYDRYDCRLREMRESVKILRQVCSQVPEGPIRTKVPRVVKAPANEVYTRVEGPRGECGFYVVSDGSDKPYRVRFRTGSFTAMSIIEHLSPGLMIADLVALIGSLDIIAPEIDR